MQPSAQVFVSNIKSQLLPDLIGKLGWVYWEGGWEEGIPGCDVTKISEDKCPLSGPSRHCSAQSGLLQTTMDQHQCVPWDCGLAGEGEFAGLGSFWVQQTSL